MIFQIQFPQITGQQCPHSRHSSLTSQTTKNEENDYPEDSFLSLASCNDEVTSGWFTKAIDDVEQVCWKENLRNKHGEPFCLYKKKPLVAS